MLRTISVLAIGLAMTMNACAHDMDHPDEDAWYESLKQPGQEVASCCGKADSYFCDGLRRHDGKNFCVITDDRIIPGRTVRPIGTEIEIPDDRMMDEAQMRAKGNPTGHAIVFLSQAQEIPWVYCFVMSSGI
jgi:hypothetical protein